jgi:flagellar protein FliT
MSGKPRQPAGARAPRGGATSGTGDPGLIAYYERIADASHSMLEAAYAGDWVRFEQIADQCQGLIAALRDASANAALGEQDRQRRLVLLREILRDDARIRAHAEPWLRDLDEFLA